MTQPSVRFGMVPYDGPCQDCKKPSDLGMKCRACYAAWQRYVWRDIPGRLQELWDVCRELRRMPLAKAKLVADFGLGRGNGTLSGRDAELFSTVKRVLEGPFKSEMSMVLTGWGQSKQPERTGGRGRASEDLE